MPTNHLRKLADILIKHMTYITPTIDEVDGLIILKLTNSGYGIERVYTEKYLTDIPSECLEKDIVKCIKEVWKAMVTKCQPT